MAECRSLAGKAFCMDSNWNRKFYDLQDLFPALIYPDYDK